MGLKPLAIDLFCGLGGWTEGLLAEGYRVVGFDIERHHYGEAKYPAQLVIQDVLTLHGSQFKDAALIVASPPCQEYSYMAMPWTRAKAIAADYRTGKRDTKKLTALFDACFRIQREAIEAAGHHIPLVVENVRGAIPWLGRSRWNFGSFHLWGDVPALMPIPIKRGWKGSVGTVNGSGKHREQSSWDRGEALKNPGFRFDGSGKSFQSESVNRMDEGIKAGDRNKGRSSGGHRWDTGFDKTIEGVKVASEAGRRTDQGKGARFTSRDCGVEAEGVKFSQSGAAWFDGTPRDKMLGNQGPAAFGSKSNARKAASAAIAKIPIVLAQHIARSWHP